MKRALLLIGAAVALAGCDGGEFSDLKAELATLTKDVRGKVDPLPVVKPYEPVSYQAFDQADPFGPAKIQLATKSGGPSASSALAPDLNRPKEPLEAFPLESLNMVGSMQQGKATYGLVRTPERDVFQVRVGNYMGQDYGVVTAITDAEIRLKELVQDSAGDWTERSSTLQLIQADSKTQERRK